MKWSYILFAFCVLLFPHISLVNCFDDDKELILDLTEVDRSGYIDPFDMFNYEGNSIPKTGEPNNQKDPFNTLPQPSVQHEKITNNIIIEDNTESPVEKKYLTLLQTGPGSQKHKAINKAGDLEKPFLLRFVLILSNLLTTKDRVILEGENLEIPLLAILSKQSKFVIEDVLALGENIPPSKFADLDEVLSSMFKLDEKRNFHQDSGSLYQRLMESVNYHAKDCLVFMYLFCIFYIFKLVLCGHSLRTIILRSLIPLLVTSWYWHWHHLDRQASAKRQSDLAKASQPPAACNPETLDAWSSIKLYVSTTFLRNADPCEEYHKALLTDPSFEVNPLVALTDMLAIILFKPLRYIGEQAGGFFDGVLSSTTFITMLPVFLAVLAIILVGFFMMFGYELHTPLFQITSKTALTDAQLKSAVPTQILLDSSALQALHMYRRAESGVLERENLDVPRIQPHPSSSAIEKELFRKETCDPPLPARKQEVLVDSHLSPRQDRTSIASQIETLNGERNSKPEPNQENHEETQGDEIHPNTERTVIENLPNEATEETAIEKQP